MEGLKLKGAKVSYFEIKEFVPTTNIYDYSAYPDVGLFKCGPDQYVAIYHTSGIRTGVMLSIPGGLKEVDLPEKQEQDLATILSVALHKKAAIEFIRSSSK